MSVISLLYLFRSVIRSCILVLGMRLISFLRGISMKRAIDVVIDIHTQAEIDRLKKDIRQKCEQISQLYGGEICYEDPKFFRKKGKKLEQIQ